MNRRKPIAPWGSLELASGQVYPRKHLLTYRCATCKSENVGKDAFAVWSKKAQRWELKGEPYDQAVCFDCMGNTDLEVV